jgi:hypothetical protein
MSFLGSWAPDFVDHALDSAGKAAGSAVDIVTDAAGTIGDGLKYIPVIGPLYSAIWTHVTSPLAVLNGIVQGNPIDKVALDTLHREVKVAKDIAPYAQTAMQFVPGVGPVASGAISAGIALANGQTIDEALVEGVKGMIPGGQLAKVAFDTGKAALQGKDIKEVALSQVTPLVNSVGVPVPPLASKAIAAGLHVAQGAAQGQPIDSMLVSEVIEQLPPDQRAEARLARDMANGAKLSDILLEAGQRELLANAPNVSTSKQLSDALKVGIAIGTAKHYQNAFKDEAANQAPFLAQAGAQLSAADAAMKAAQDIIAFHNTAIMKNVSKSSKGIAAPIAKTIASSKQVGVIKTAPVLNDFPWGDTPWQEMQGFAGENDSDANETRYGFDVGTGLMTHAGMTRAQYEAVRNTLSPLGKKGFDAAIAYHVGSVTQRTPPSLSPEAKAAYLVTKGLQGRYPTALKAALIGDFAATPTARIGAAIAVNEFAARKSWLDSLLSLF